MPFRRWTTWCEAKFVLLLLIAGALLLLADLGNIYLWQDEAETAMLSQRLGTFGLPLAFDGRNLIRQAPQDVQYTEDYVWVYHPWLPFYLTSLSLSLLGPTTFAARLPYALAGLATVWLLYHSTTRYFHRHVAMLASTLLLFCIPFALHARQCKYFAFAALFTVATLDAYLRLRDSDSPRFALPYFIAAAFFLFQSNFGAFVPLMASIGLHLLASRPRWAELRRFVLAGLILAMCVVPWAIYLQTWARGRFTFDLIRFVGHLAHYAVYITGWVFPVPLLMVFGLLLARQYTTPSPDRGEFSVVTLYLLVGLITVLFLSATFIWMYFSYIVQLVPLLMVLLAWTVWHVLRRWRLLGYALLAVLITTNFLHAFPYVLPITRQFKWASLAPRPYLAETDALLAAAGQIRSDLRDYGYELVHDYNGPNEGIVKFLHEQADPGDLVVTNYGELPIAFYTGLDIAGGLSGYRLEAASEAQWIINRRNGPYYDELARLIAEGSYESVEIPYPDLPWGNRPVPEYHKFATVHDAPNVVVHRRNSQVGQSE
jgi:4-amino-4-deoxy-L-arabinose transferase-like glycosyltransferase